MDSLKDLSVVLKIPSKAERVTIENNFATMKNDHIVDSYWFIDVRINHQ